MSRTFHRILITIFALTVMQISQTLVQEGLVSYNAG